MESKGQNVSTPWRTLDERAKKLVEHVRWSVEHRPGERAALRRSIGADPADLDTVRAPARRVVAGHLHDSDGPAVERAFYAVAALVAGQPRDTGADATDDKRSEQPSKRRDEQGKQRTDLGTALARSVLQEPWKHAAGEDDPEDENRKDSPQEKRLHLLCRQDLDGLHRHLPRVMRFLRSQDIEVDWPLLACDLAAWNREGGRNPVAKRWLDRYYRALLDDKKNGVPRGQGAVDSNQE